MVDRILTERMDFSYGAWGIAKDTTSASIDDLAYDIALPYLMFARGALTDDPGYLLGSGGLFLAEVVTGKVIGGLAKRGFGFLAKRFPKLIKKSRLLLRKIFKTPQKRIPIETSKKLPILDKERNLSWYDVETGQTTQRLNFPDTEKQIARTLKTDSRSEFFKIQFGNEVYERLKKASTARNLLEAIEAELNFPNSYIKRILKWMLNFIKK